MLCLSSRVCAVRRRLALIWLESALRGHESADISGVGHFRIPAELWTNLPSGTVMSVLKTNRPRRSTADSGRSGALLAVFDDLQEAHRCTVAKGNSSLIFGKTHNFNAANGRGDWIRTNDLRFPKPSRCQTAPRPDATKILPNRLPRKAKWPIAGLTTDDGFDFRHRFQVAMLFRH